jgi:hypothetical protein
VAFKAGTTTAVYLANAAAALQNISPYADNISWPQSVAQLEVSAFGTAPKAFIPGLTDGDTITVSGPADSTLASQLFGLKAAQSAGSAAAGIIYGPGGSVASQIRVAGSVYVAGITLSSGVGGRQEFSASLQVTGAISAGTF